MIAATAGVDSAAAWWRLSASVALMVIGASGMYVVVVVLPAVQAEFGVARADASLPYTLTMIGVGLGGVLMGRLADRFGILLPLIAGIVCLAGGFVLAGLSESLSGFVIAHGVLIGLFGTSVTFAPLVADTSLWFERRRGVAVGICAAGNYVGGWLWPPAVQWFVDGYGWRATYVGIGVFCLVTMLPLAFRLRRRPPLLAVVSATPVADASGPQRPVASRPPVAAAPVGGWPAGRPLGFSPGSLQAILCLAGLSCCVAMSMPQVHLVAYCTDLGYGAARGATLLSLAFAFSIVSRVVSGMICDRIGGLRTLLLGSVLQMIALTLYLPFDGLSSLYVVSAFFGLVQGGIVPSYAIIVRELYPPAQAGVRVGAVLTATMFGMALGGWLSGVIFDLTGSYDAAFLNGIGWNLLNVAIALLLLVRSGAWTVRRLSPRL